LANPELGAKQICPNCQAKFYDLGRRPATCPKCGTAFDPEEAVRSRRMKARSTVPDYEADDEKPAKAADPDVEGFEDEPDDTPEIDEAAEAEPIESDEEGGDEAAPASPADDLGVDFAEDDVEGESEDDDSVPFLEDEDDDFADEEIEGIGEDDGEEH
jgi:uncharacterized protein (TIGR02300 family)